MEKAMELLKTMDTNTREIKPAAKVMPVILRASLTVMVIHRAANLA
jgi:hypothetical protein